MSRTLAITPGDPTGIGPEVILKSLASSGRPEDTKFVLVGSFDLGPSIYRWAPKLTWETVDRPEAIRTSSSRFVRFAYARLPDSFAPGHSDEKSAAAALGDLNAAIDLAQNRIVDALVTGPVSKESIQKIHPGFIGVTEHLAQRTMTRHPVMAFFSDILRVALVTTHLPLKKVGTVLSSERIAQTLKISHEALTRMCSIPEPRIAVCGLNPHAGEHGLFGREEETIILPAMEIARSWKIDCSGPYPADSLFRRAMKGEFDLVVAMYHDQGLGPVKTVAPHAVNVTLGVPFVRTSASHGTAFDRAGQGTADPEPMLHAVRLAARMSAGTSGLF